MRRFLANDTVPSARRSGPVQDTFGTALTERPVGIAAVVYDWRMHTFHTHIAKRDR